MTGCHEMDDHEVAGDGHHIYLAAYGGVSPRKLETRAKIYEHF